MYFKKLELVGFKSFPDKTVLHFESGITAIVGPNGCGKSNIFDAIRWVLGEQSVKALRGIKMEDVIFSGTDSKEPLGMAEVSLTFSNENRNFNIDDKEFVVTRRIYRSGESEYLLNRNQVRLKDITDLLMGTGVGAEAYSLVEQGKIDLILSSRPEDRRLVFDEASGITKYKAQKREALRKLEETEANLLRINDIANEVKRQIGSLERQANKARRYKEVFEGLKINEINLATFQINQMLKDKDVLVKRNDGFLSGLQSTQNDYSQILTQQENKNQELEELEGRLVEIREEILNSENLKERNLQHIRMNQDRALELQKQKDSSDLKIEQLKNKIKTDKEKIDNFNREYQGLKDLIEQKNTSLRDKEGELSEIFGLIKEAHEKINQAKKDIFELINSQAKVKNALIDLNTKLQNCLARQKRLDIEKEKVLEEKNGIEKVISGLKKELEEIEGVFNHKNNQFIKTRENIEIENKNLEILKNQIQELEKEKIGLVSQKEFLENLNLRYEQIHESMNGLVLLDRRPRHNISGLVVKIKNQMPSDSKDKAILFNAQYKLVGEARPIDLDTEEIKNKIDEIEKVIAARQGSLLLKESEICSLSAELKELEKELHQKELALAGKRSHYNNVDAQLNKINDELKVIELELSESRLELKDLKEKETQLINQQSALEREHKEKEGEVSDEQKKISALNTQREENVIFIAKIKTELEALNKWLLREDETLKMLESTLELDEEGLLEFKNQINDIDEKLRQLNQEIDKLSLDNQEIAGNKAIMLNTQGRLKEGLKQVQQELSQSETGLESQRQKVGLLKDEINQSQIKIQELDFKILNIRERITQSYKTEIDNPTAHSEDFNVQLATGEIQALKEKLDSYGTVNLVAIEEYDELKVRYDFLSQQQNDLIQAKNSLHEAISKINRTARKMFSETFKAISEEFRNYFRLLFGGGDANLFLIDENDPLESGIEIICRPPGKKLQNISLLSGGEKSLSAIALLFAIFKVKPSPFCVLDEVDAALDEANVDRYGRTLQEFSKTSQFIVITHNKRTIVNADVMYGITMEESGISKIVSVKFSENKPLTSPLEEEAVTA